MIRHLIALAVAAALSAGGYQALNWWEQQLPAFEEDIVLRGRYIKPKPKGDPFLKNKKKDSPMIPLPGSLKTFGELPKERWPGDWPQFRGARFDAVNHEDVKLADSWGPKGPPERWYVDLGEGYSGPAVHEGLVYLLDYDQAKQADALRCFDLASGKEIWRRTYSVFIKRQHGYSRTVPAVAGRYVVTMGPLCDVLCCDRLTGEALWSIDCRKVYGSEVPEWYAAQCPIIVEINGKLCAIIAPGGKALMIAVDCETGEVVWSTANPKVWHMTHSSVAPMTVGGQRTLVYPTTGGVIGVDTLTGKLLWKYARWTISPANVPMPIVVGEDQVFLCGGYGAGSLMLRIKNAGGTFSAEEVFKIPPKICGSDQQTPIKLGKHFYMVLPKDAGGLKAQLTCFDEQGKTLWTSGAGAQFGIGPFMAADGKIFLLNDTGTLTMCRATPDGYKQLGQAQPLSGHDSWGPLAIAGGLLLARDNKRMVCLDLRPQK